MPAKRKTSAAGVGAKATKLMTPVVKPAAFVPAKATADESRATVSSALASGRQPGLIVHASQEPIELSSDSEDGDSLDEDPDDEEEDGGRRDDDDEIAGSADFEHEEQMGSAAKRKPRETAGDSTSLPTPDYPHDADERARSETPTPPTFGELVRAASPVTVDVAAALAQQPTPAPDSTSGRAAAAVVVESSSSNRGLTTITPSSLATVLTQALKTDDRELLESCLQVTDLVAVRNTIQRLESRLAILLLTKLADRMHRRPGRAGTLMIWVQWTVVSHGGALGSNRAAVRQLESLQRVLEERAKGLSSLLVLKGKLDLLEGQMQLRRAHRSGQANGFGPDEDEDVVFLEGEDQRRKPRFLAIGGAASAKPRAVVPDSDEKEEEEEGSDADVPAIDGVIADSEDEEEDDYDSEEEDGDDDEAAEVSGDEDDVDHDDVDEEEEEDSEPEGVPPAKKRR